MAHVVETHRYGPGQRLTCSNCGREIPNDSLGCPYCLFEFTGGRQLVETHPDKEGAA